MKEGENKNKNIIDFNYLKEAAKSFKGDQNSLSDGDLCQIFYQAPYGWPFSLDDAIEFMKTRCEKGEKISFKTLNELNRFENIKSCELKTLYDFISEYVEQNSNNSDYITYKEEDEMEFFAYLYRYVKIGGILLDAENQKYVKYFINRQGNLFSRVCVVKEFYRNQFYRVGNLAVGSLNFKDHMKQYSSVSDLQNDILKHVKVIVDCCINNKCDDDTIKEYLSSFYYHFDEERIKEVFDTDFMYKLKGVILSENKKISHWWQIVFLRDVCSFCHKFNTENYFFETVCKFVFNNQDLWGMKEIIGETYRKAQNNECYMYEDLIRKFMSGKFDRDWDKSYTESIKADSTEFINFCNIFRLKTKKVVKLKKSSLSYLQPKYFSCFNDKLINNYNRISTVTIKKNVLSEEEFACTYVYKIFARTVFLMFGFVPLIILKSVFDILFLAVRLIINIVCCVVRAFRTKKYAKLIKEIFVDILSILASPILYSRDNFRDSKYLLSIFGSGKKILTFDNWYFFDSEEKIRNLYDAKNFNISDMNLWFFVKYIFGFERIIRLDEFDDDDENVDLGLTVERKLSVNEKENKIEDRQPIPISKFTNEYSPLRYFEIS